MRPIVLATTFAVAVLAAAAPASARADAVEDFARAWVRGEALKLSYYHDDYRGTAINDGILAVFRKPQLRGLFEKDRRERKNIRVLAFTMRKAEETGDRIEVSFWHRQIVDRGGRKVETQSETTGTIVRGGPAGLQCLLTDTTDYFIRHIP
jgi:hypothetical protein